MFEKTFKRNKNFETITLPIIDYRNTRVIMQEIEITIRTLFSIPRTLAAISVTASETSPEENQTHKFSDFPDSFTFL